ncbi:MAG: DUF433 domain-containing protein [Desulfobacterales bacterium]|nr:DUF433 domain-containing protein [Desulfobacterales bacterium]
MKTETLLDRITIHSEIMLGKPTIRGMRITVEQFSCGCRCRQARRKIFI